MGQVCTSRSKVVQAGQTGHQEPGIEEIAMSAPTTTTEPIAAEAEATPVKKTAKKKAAAKTTATAAETKATEAAQSDQLLITHTRETEVQRLLDAGWSRAALSREAELAGSTIMWRVGRLTGPDVSRLDALLKRIDDDQVAPPARKSTGGGTRTGGPSRAALVERIEKATHRLDAGITEKSVAKLRDAIGEALDLLRGDQPQTQTD
jgi:hypothetical protein